MQQKILLVQLFSNGDCLYATTVARQIKNDYPACYLVWMIADYCSAIIDNNPYVDEKVVVKDINYANWKQHWKGFMAYMKDYQQANKIGKTFFTQLIDDNYANYDYCIRSSIFRGYGRPITVPVQPVLNLSGDEIDRVKEFAESSRLSDFSSVILFEFSPRSGQSNFSKEQAIEVANALTKNRSVCVILSSASLLDVHHSAIIDGSVLSLRETAYLTHFCTLMVGCSSGITWVSTSDAARQLPMVQILDPQAYWLNSVANDHKRFGLPDSHIIELSNPSTEKIRACIEAVLDKGVNNARSIYHENLPQPFKMTRGIITYLLKKGNIKGYIKHIQVNLKLFGWNFRLLKMILIGTLLFPIMIFKTKKG